MVDRPLFGFGSIIPSYEKSAACHDMAGIDHHARCAHHAFCMRMPCQCVGNSWPVCNQTLPVAQLYSQVKQVKGNAATVAQLQATQLADYELGRHMPPGSRCPPPHPRNSGSTGPGSKWAIHKYKSMIGLSSPGVEVGEQQAAQDNVHKAPEPEKACPGATPRCYSPSSPVERRAG